EALVHVFARFGEIVVDRLNRAPEKNFLAFLDLIGVSPLPPQAARVPLTFDLVADSKEPAVVRAGAQVAAKLGKGEVEPVIFETERELVVVSAKLESLFIKNGGRDEYVRLSSVLSQTPSLEVSQAPGSILPDRSLSIRKITHIPHFLYVALPDFPRWSPLNK